MDAVVYPTDFGRARSGRPMSKQAIAAIGISAAVHLAVFGYIANEKFKEIQSPRLEEPVVDGTITKFHPEQPPPAKDSHQPPNPIVVHVPDSVIPSLDQHVDPLITAVVAPSASEGPPQVLPQTVDPPVKIAALTAPATPVRDRVIGNPTWQRKPTASEMERIYPRRALDLEKSGGATLLCTVSASGTVGACSVIDESPNGLGFGEAAVAASKFFKLSPRTVDGDAVGGAKVRIPLVFNLAG